MVRFRRSLLAIVVGSAMISRVAPAQRPSFSSLTHTVFVTVPPRLKVEVASLSSTVLPVNIGPSTPALSLNVSASQAWVLSIGSNPSSVLNSKVLWSLEPGAGFSKLTASHVRIASGARAADPKAAIVFFRSALDTASLSHRADSSAPIVLTISAP